MVVIKYVFKIISLFSTKLTIFSNCCFDFKFSFVKLSSLTIENVSENFISLIVNSLFPNETV